MALRFAGAVNRLLAALLVGNEFGSWAVVHPALDRLPAPARIRTEQDVYRRHGRVMPVLMNLGVFSVVPDLSLTRDRGSAVFLALGGFGCLLAMLAMTLVGNLPLKQYGGAPPPARSAAAAAPASAASPRRCRTARRP